LARRSLGEAGKPPAIGSIGDGKSPLTNLRMNLADELRQLLGSDIVADDGQKITLGDTAVTIIATPGHTPGTLSMIFTVKDNGKPLTVAYSGGTAFNFPSTVPNFDTYIKSQGKMAAAAAAANATILMSNHTEFDNAVPKIRMMAARKPGEPHPFEIGKEAVARYFTVTGECAQAARLKLLQTRN